MKRLAILLIAAALSAAPAVRAAVKYVAVVETEIDAASGAAAEITSAEVRLMTAELRREAVKNLPRGKYNIMTSETVMAQGGAVLEECAEENCVIALGSKIGADYIVRGIISKLRTRFTLSVEIYETENGNLVASSDPVRSENISDLIEKAAGVCAEMYKTFAASHSAPQRPAQQSPAPKAPAAAYTITAAADPAAGGSVSRNPDQPTYAPETRVNIMAVPAKGYTFTGWAGDAVGRANPVMLKMDANKTLVANFKRLYTLTTYASPLGGGYVARNPNKGSYTDGEEVTLTAEPANGYKFTGWKGITAAATDRILITIDGDRTIAASFTRKETPPPAAQTTKTAAPKPTQKNFGLGGGMLYSGNFGGGIQWEGGVEILAMPYDALGAYIFLDLAYAAVSAAYQSGGGYWSTPNNVSPTIYMPYMQRSAVNIGAFAKYPNIAKFSLPLGAWEYQTNIYPLYGLECESATSGKLEFANDTYVFDGGNEDGYAANALSALWIKIGAGIDVYFAENTPFFRFELLYGVITANKYETDKALAEGAGVRIRHGVTLRVGAGFRL